MKIAAIEIAALSVPLLEPFVIASARIETTRAALVRATLTVANGERVDEQAVGLGEAAALPGVTREDQPELLTLLATAADGCSGRTLSSLRELTELLDQQLGHSAVARAGLESALLDAWSQLEGQPLYAWLAEQEHSLDGTPQTQPQTQPQTEPQTKLITDITLPICEPAHMAELAAGYHVRGWDVFKVKVGKHLADDIRALSAVHLRVPQAKFRLDANAGFSAHEALQLMAAARNAGLHVECFEQPCGTHDLEGMARVTREAGVPVVADESVKTLADFERVRAAGAAHGVNLKLAKSGGLLAALELGRTAKRHGFSVMCGGMVETRLGMSAMAHVAAALGGVTFVDLDTAFLLASDPFDGGYQERGPELQLTSASGLGLTLRELA